MIMIIIIPDKRRRAYREGFKTVSRSADALSSVILTLKKESAFNLRKTCTYHPRKEYFTMKRLLSVLSLFVLLTGCGDGSDSSGSVSPIIGNWRLRSLANPQNGDVFTCPATFSTFTCTANDTAEFRTDGTVISDGNLRTYTLNGDKLSFFGMPSDVAITVTFSGNFMTWQALKNNVRADFLFEKL